MIPWRYLIISLHSPKQTASGSIPFLQTWPFTLDRTKFMALLPGLNGERSSLVPVERSVSTRGWRNQFHKMIHNGKTCWKSTSFSTFGQEHGDDSLTQQVSDPHIPSKNWCVERLMVLKTKLLKYLSEKQTYHGRALGAFTAWLAPPWVSKNVWGAAGFAISSDKSPEKCKPTGSSKRDVSEKWTASFDWTWNRNQT